MKRILLASAMLIAGALLLQACEPSAATEAPPTPTASPTSTNTPTPAPTITPTPSRTPTTPPEVDMYGWLINHPYIVIPDDFQLAVQADDVTPPVSVDDLPEGFIVTESRGGVAYLPEGEVYLSSTTYLFPVDDQVSLENDVRVSITAYSNEAVREHHFEVLSSSRTAYLQSIGGIDVLYFYDQTTLGQIWISGPFAIVVGSAPPADGTPNAWLRIFSEFLLDMYPPQVD